MKAQQRGRQSKNSNSVATIAAEQVANLKTRQIFLCTVNFSQH